MNGNSEWGKLCNKILTGIWISKKSLLLSNVLGRKQTFQSKKVQTGWELKLETQPEWQSASTLENLYLLICKTMKHPLNQSNHVTMKPHIKCTGRVSHTLLDLITFPTEGPGQKTHILILIVLLIITSSEMLEKSFYLFAPLCPFFVKLKVSSLVCSSNKILILQRQKISSLRSQVRMGKSGL